MPPIGPKGIGAKRVGVIGAGMVGVCAASWLQRDGHSVFLIEASLPGHGASFGNAGCFNGSSVTPVAMPGVATVPPIPVDSGATLVLGPTGPMASASDATAVLPATKSKAASVTPQATPVTPQAAPVITPAASVITPDEGTKPPSRRWLWVSAGAVATVAVFTMIPIWNDLWFPLILAPGEATKTVTLGAQQFIGQFLSDWNAILASLTLAMVPVLAAYMLFSRSLIRGLTTGALK